MSPPYIFGWISDNEHGDIVDIPEHHFTFTASSPSTSMHSSISPPPAPIFGGQSDNKPEAGESKIPRPPNPFIIFRTEYARIHHNPQRNRPRRPLPKALGQTVSGRAANAWRELPPEEKERYRQLAEEAKKKHAEDYPNYQYRPKRRENPGSSSSRAPPAPAPAARKRSHSPMLSVRTTHITAMDALKISDSPPMKKRSCSPQEELAQLPAVGSSVKAARRRSSSVPVTSGEHFYTLGLWTPAEESPRGERWERPVQSKRRSRSVTHEWINLVPSFHEPEAGFLDPRSPQNALFSPSMGPTPFRVLSPHLELNNTVNPAAVFAPPHHMSPLAAVASSLAAWNGAAEPAGVSVPAAPMAPRPVRPNPPTWLAREDLRFDSLSPDFEPTDLRTPLAGEFQWPSEYGDAPSSHGVGKVCDQSCVDAVETYEFGLQERVYGADASSNLGMFSDDPTDELRF